MNIIDIPESSQELEKRNKEIENPDRNLCLKHQKSKYIYCEVCEKLLCSFCSSEDYLHTEHKPIRNIGEKCYKAVYTHFKLLKLISEGIEEIKENLNKFCNSNQINENLKTGLNSLMSEISEIINLFLEESQDLFENLSDALESNDFYYLFIKRFSEKRANEQKQTIVKICEIIKCEPRDFTSFLRNIMNIKFFISNFLGFLGSTKSRKFKQFYYFNSKFPNTIKICYSRFQKKKSIIKIPFGIKGMGVAFCGDSCFFSGGAENLYQFKEFRLSNFTVKPLKSMIVPKMDHILINVNREYFYAIGGCENIREPSLKCIKYNMLMNEWKYTAFLPIPFIYCDACVFNEYKIFLISPTKIAFLDTLDEESGWQVLGTLSTNAGDLNYTPIQLDNSQLLVFSKNLWSSSTILNIVKKQRKQAELESYHLKGKPIIENGFLLFSTKGAIIKMNLNNYKR